MGLGTGVRALRDWVNRGGVLALMNCLSIVSARRAGSRELPANLSCGCGCGCGCGNVKS